MNSIASWVNHYVAATYWTVHSTSACKWCSMGNQGWASVSFPPVAQPSVCSRVRPSPPRADGKTLWSVRASALSLPGRLLSLIYPHVLFTGRFRSLSKQTSLCVGWRTAFGQFQLLVTAQSLVSFISLSVLSTQSRICGQTFPDSPPRRCYYRRHDLEHTLTH